jgi:vancomycin permeability regulator SanA
MFLLFKIAKRFIALVLLLVIILPLYAVGNVYLTARNAKPVKSDAIVVLGAAQFNGRPSDVLQARLLEAKRIYAAGYAPLIITIGSNAAGDRTTEAATGFHWLANNGLSKRHLIPLAIGRDTLSQTEEYAKELKARKLKSVIIVTDEFHCLRAMTMAKDQGITTSCAPAKTGPASTQNSGFKYLVRETGAYLAYVTVGRHGIHLSDQVKN